MPSSTTDSADDASSISEQGVAMSRYSIFSLVRNRLSYHENWERQWRSPGPKKEYDVVIVVRGRHRMFDAAQKSCGMRVFVDVMTVEMFVGLHDHEHHERQSVTFRLELRYLLKSIVKNTGSTPLERNLGTERYFSYIVIQSPFFKQTMRLDKLLSDDDSEERAR
jgi:hypothetical protein